MINPPRECKTMDVGIESDKNEQNIQRDAASLSKNSNETEDAVTVANIAVVHQTSVNLSTCSNSSVVLEDKNGPEPTCSSMCKEQVSSNM
jgi:hypothetical protein